MDPSVILWLSDWLFLALPQFIYIVLEEYVRIEAYSFGYFAVQTWCL